LVSIIQGTNEARNLDSAGAPTLRPAGEPEDVRHAKRERATSVMFGL
jgi:hypothetical protein